MTIKPSVLGSLPDGTGLVDGIVDPHYHALTTEQPVKPIVAVVILDPVEHGSRKTAKNTHRTVKYAVTRLEPVLDANTANELRYLIQALYEQRTSTGEQRALPLGLGGDREKQIALIERIEDWSKDTGQTGGELDALWRETFGIGPDQDWSMGDHGIPGDYRKAGYTYLLEFAGKVGAVDTGERADDKDTGEPDDGGEAEGDASTSGPSAEGAEPDTAVGVACQVCGKKSKALSDGLCSKCAKNAGVRHLGDDAAEAAETA